MADQSNQPDYLDVDPRVMEICNRKLTPKEAEGICDSPHLCFEYCTKPGDFVRCGPCSLKLAAMNDEKTSS